MKKLYLIGGTMGIGKTTTSQILKEKLSNSVFLDGDWCWDMSPFQVTDETKHMVIENICFLLNNFIKCSVYENIIFCWVMHEQNIIDEIISRLDLTNCITHSISLICSEKELANRLQIDVKNCIRKSDVIDRSLKRLSCYDRLNTHKIDVSNISAEKVADIIINL